MSQKVTGKFGRRALIKGLGITAAAPFIPMLEGDVEAAGGLPKRVCFMTNKNGIHPDVIPTGTATNFNFRSVLEPLAPHKDDITYLHGIDMKTWLTNRIPNDHPPTVPQLLTANDSLDPQDGKDPASNNAWSGISASIDQVLKDRLQADPNSRTLRGVINAGVDSGQFAGKHVFRGRGEHIYPINSPARLHQTLFEGFEPDDNGEGTPDPRTERRLAERKSVIDYVRTQLKAAEGRVSLADRRKMEAHLEALRELEARLDFVPPPPIASCSVPPVPNDQNNSEQGRIANGHAMMTLITHAFSCDIARVATLQWGNGDGFGSIGINTDHHELTHQDYDANSGNRAKIGKWFAQRFLFFIEALKAIPEGDGSVFDNTLLVWTSEHSDHGQHSRSNIPYVLAGSMGGGIQTGRFLDFSSNKKAHNDVYVSVAHAMGFTDMATFGKASLSEGPLPGLLV